MIKYAFFIICFFIVGSLSGQEVAFTVAVTADTLYMGNPLGIKYTIENKQGDFEPPSFEGFEIIGGPNVSNQMSMINGDVTQSASYEYYLMPLNIGPYRIDAASLKSGEGTWSSDEVYLIVVDNPEGIQQNYTRYNSKSTMKAPGESVIMTKEDSLRMKLRKIKSTRI